MRDDGLRGPKRTLRRRIIALRDGLEPVTRRDYSILIADKVAGLRAFRDAHTVHVFASFGSEVDTTPIMDRILESRKRCVLPVVIGGTREMEHACIRGRADLTPGFRGIPEPSPACPRVDAREVDLVIVPGVAFDGRGGRLGYGGGFYDRFLLASGAHRVAVAFGIQVVGSVPREPHDLPVHVIVTESQIIEATPGTPAAR